MIPHTKRECRRQAFTLLEMLISMTLLGLVLGSLAMMSAAGDRAFQTSTVRTNLEGQTVSTLDRVLRDLRLGVEETLLPNLADDEFTASLEYAQAVELVGTHLQLGDTRRIAFEYETGEIDDGVDNNGNGLIDEGRVVRTEGVGTPDEHSFVLTHGVRELLGGEEPNGIDDNGNGLIDEPGFLIRKQGRTVIVELTLERLDRDGRTLRRTARSSTKLRN